MSQSAGWPPLDRTLSPHTGWTRAHWVALLSRLTHGFARRIAVSGSPARVLYPDDRADHPDAVDGLESFSRLAAVWGAWLRNPANPATLTFNAHSHDLTELLAQGLVQGTDPRAPASAYWGDITHMDQRIVECANLAVAVYLSRDRVFSHLTAAEKARVMAWLAQVDGQGTYPDNWVLFPALSQAVRLRLGYGASEADLRHRLEQMAAFYRGDGWYVDGPGDEFDLYNAWMFGWHYLFWAWIDGDRHPDLRQAVLHRARSFQAGFTHFFGANGVYVPWGRSLGSRFGAVGTFALGHLLGIAPGGPGLLRRLSSGCLRYHTELGLFHPREHYLTQGFHGHNPAALESYVSPGSPNSAVQGLLALTLDPDDSFWTAVEEPLPVERADFELVLPTPGFVVSGRRATGQVLLLNSRCGHIEDVARADYPPKYGKLAYSSHFPLNVIPAAGSYAPDAMLALTRDGRRFGHRVLTRQGGAAPGLVWSQFDQDVDGDPQPMWSAVLLWRDAQVVVATLQPTRPLRAFYAPGTLGTDRPATMVRRSNMEAAWEYAEVDGRALAVKRLVGYTGQQASAPFLGRANLNLAYPYAEQPFVCEMEPSVEGRSLASVALVRPAPFDPAVELSGFVVEPGPRGHFAVSFPDGERAAVVLAPQPPAQLELAGTVFHGPAVRYARLRPNGAGACGAGVSDVADMITFDSAATFRLARTPRAVHLTTDTGASLSPAWLGDKLRHADVRALDGAWAPVDTDMPGVIPGSLVREWQQRNERTLIDFRIRR